MFEPVLISPSILSANFMSMAQEVAMMKRAGANWVHVDVMDGHFVPNLTMGVPVVKQLKSETDLPLDVHLMISNPLQQIPWFIDAGADIVTFHAEALDGAQTHEAIRLIHDMGAKAGISVKPKTPVADISEFVPLVDMVLVMSVEPGFSGQSYIEGSDGKVADVVRIAKDAKASPIIQVDGGIGLGTLAKVVEAGADCLVCGNAIFASPSPEDAIKQIAQAAEDARAFAEARRSEQVA